MKLQMRTQVSWALGALGAPVWETGAGVSGVEEKEEALKRMQVESSDESR